MAALVTIDQVNLALRMDLQTNNASPPVFNDIRVPDVLMKMDQATDIVLDYIKNPANGWSVNNVPGQVSAAIILVIAALFDDFERADMLAGLSGSDLKNPVVGLLYRMRDPSIA